MSIYITVCFVLNVLKYKLLHVEYDSSFTLKLINSCFLRYVLLRLTISLYKSKSLNTMILICWCDDIVWWHFSVEDITNLLVRLIVVTLLEVVLKNFTCLHVLYDYSVVLDCNVCFIDRCSCGNPWVEQ